MPFQPKPITFREFRAVYADVIRCVWENWTPEMQSRIAEHNWGWRECTYNFHTYLEASATRFYKAYCHIQRRGPEQSICDIGGFWGVFPITLRRLGYRVHMTECLAYYAKCFDRLFEAIRDEGVTIVDYDPFAEGRGLPEEADFVTVLAVLEHYPHSLRDFFHNVTSSLKPDGHLYVEVPNIAYWPKRMALLRGNTPLVPITDIYRSRTPFIGHHHEFTMRELRQLVQVNGFAVVDEDRFNYSLECGTRMKTFLRHPLRPLIFLCLRDSREILSILCQKVASSITTKHAA